jgi:hypothetical protein
MRVEIKLIRGRIVPCDTCNTQIKCAMFRSLAMNRARYSEYMSGTNRRHSCDIYTPAKIPGDNRRKALWSDYK